MREVIPIKRGFKMQVQNLSEDVVLVVLPAEPQTSDALKSFNKIVSTRCDFDVIVDFSKVEMLTSPTVSNLVILHRWVLGSGQKLVLCNVSFATKCIFRTTRLDTILDFADDKFSALEFIRRAETVHT